MILHIPLPLAIYLIIGGIFVLGGLYTQPSIKLIQLSADEMPLPAWLIYVIMSLSMIAGIVFWLPVLIQVVIEAIKERSK